MLKKTITYEDFNGKEVSEEHYFHLSKADLVEMEVSHDGGLSVALEEIIKSSDGKAIIREFKNLILNSHGKKSPDGKRFIKSRETSEDFQSTEAYSALFMELVTNADAAAEFVNGIIPKGMEADVSKIGKDDVKMPMLGTRGEPTPEEPPIPNLRTTEATPENPMVLTQAQVREMPADELHHLLATGKARLDSSEG